MKNINKRIYSACLLIIFFVISMAVAVNAKSFEKDEIRIGIPSTDLLAFFEEDEQGNLTGSDILLAQNIGDVLGKKIVFDRTAANNDELTQKLEDGEIDMIIATYSRTIARVQRVALSEPYMSIGMGIMVNKQGMLQRGLTGNPISYLKQNKEKIAVVAGTSHVSLCKQLFPMCEIVEAEDYDEAAELVNSNQVLGFFCGELEFYSQFLKRPELQIYTDVYIFSDIKDEFCVAVAKENKELLDIVNLYLETGKPIKIEEVKERYQQYYTQQEEMQ